MFFYYNLKKIKEIYLQNEVKVCHIESYISFLEKRGKLTQHCSQLCQKARVIKFCHYQIFYILLYGIWSFPLKIFLLSSLFLQRDAKGSHLLCWVSPSNCKKSEPSHHKHSILQANLELLGNSKLELSNPLGE